MSPAGARAGVGISAVLAVAVIAGASFFCLWGATSTVLDLVVGAVVSGSAAEREPNENQ